MSLIGSESYFELLQETIAELKGEALERDFEPEIQLTLDTAIPENYIKEIALRLSIYRRFSSAANEEAIDQIVSELDDRFGTPPLSVLNLSKVMKIVCVLRRLRIRSFASGKSGITVVFDASSPLSREKLVERALKYPKHFQLSPDGKLLIKNPTNEQPNEESLLKSVDSALSQFETLI
jgi:transcription-repair coupling factor (superfamily II helicase)